MIPKIFTREEEARQKLLQGAYESFLAVSSTYSPKSGNIGIELNWGMPVVSHDGVHVARSMGSKDGVINQGMKIITDAAEQTNRNAGDGTSATVITTYKLFERAYKLTVAGYNAMELRRGMDRAAIEIIKEIDELKISASNKDLRDIAAVSSGSDAMGALIANTMIKAGVNSGVTIEPSHTPDVTAEIVDGFHFSKGVDDIRMVNDFDLRRATLEDTYILAVDKPLKNVSDVKPIITWLNKQQNRSLLIVGSVSGDAIEVIIANNQQGNMNIVTVGAPALGNMTSEFLQDVASISGGKVIPTIFDYDKLDETWLGFASRVISNERTTTIIDGAVNSEGAQEIKLRIKRLKQQILETSDAQIVERLEGRIAKLNGKIGVISVGAPTESAVKEKILRVEDAVMATRAAREDGFVPGGATTLLRIGAGFSKNRQLTTDEEIGYKLVYDAIQDPFKVLLNNSGIEDIGYHKHAVIHSDMGYGYNVRKLTDEPINLLDAGIIDPAKVLKETIKNAVANAGLLITMNGTITIDKDEVRKDRTLQE